MRAFDSSKIPFPKGYEDFAVPLGFDAYVLEIGAGVGWNAETYARANPRHFVMAVEHSHERFGKLLNRASEAALPNLVAVQADAESFVVHCLRAESLDRVMLLYPNPYPKASQANKRWHYMPFMAELVSRLKFGGVLQMATNEDSYAGEFFEAMQDVWKLELLLSERASLDADPDFCPRTHFEKKYYERGEMLHLMEFKKA